MGKLKIFFKRNWDIISAYSIFIISFLIMFVLLSGCGGYGCIGLIMIPIFGSAIYNTFLFVGIWRTWKIKKLSRARWLWILIPMGIGLVASIFHLISPSFGITFVLSILGPIVPILFVIRFFNVLGGSAFSVVGDSVVSDNLTISNFENVLKQFPYLNEGVHQIIMKDS